jgi:carboxymethylenebutenolidase
MSRDTSSFLGLFAMLTLIFIGAARGQTPPPGVHQGASQKIEGQLIRLADFGSDDLAYLAIPNTPPTLGIVLVPDSYGLDDFTKLEADRLASEGYLVLAVDIYNGHLTTDPGDLANLTANLNAAIVMKTVDSGIRFFHESPRFRVDHVVLMGWGTGATYVFQTARESKNFDGAITFYGPLETIPEHVGKFYVPLCAVYPEKDPIATHENVETFQRLMKENGNDFEAWFIAAGSGWSNPLSKAYNHVEDKEAWKVATPFLVRIGAEPVKTKKDSIIDKAGDSIKNIFN